MSKKKKRRPDSNDGRNEKNNSVANGFSTLSDTYRDQQAANRKQQKTADRGKSYREIATLIFIIITTCGVFLQWCELRSTDHNMEIAATAAKDSADAAKMDQRAWLGIDVIRSDPTNPELGKPFIVTIQFKNTGKTPARKVVMRGRGEPVLKGKQPNYSYEGIRTFSAYISPGAMPSTQVAPMTIPGTEQSIIINDDLINGLRTGAFTVYVHGRIDYEDIFAVPHWFTYCASLVVPFNSHFGSCDSHNESDDYQPKK
jgi:hypothetical protein